MSRKDLAATALFAEKGAARPTALATSERRVRMDSEGASAGAPGRVIRLTRRPKEAPAALLPFEEGLPLEEDPSGTGSLVEFALQRVEPVGAEPVGAKAVQELLVTASESAVTEPAAVPPSWIRSGSGLAAAIAAAIVLAIGVWLAAGRDGPSVGRTPSEIETRAPAIANLPAPTQAAPVQEAQALLPPTASDREAGRAGKVHVPAVVSLPSGRRDPAVPRQVAVTEELAAFDPTGLAKPAKPAALGQVSATAIAAPPPTPARKPDQTILSGSGYWLQLFAGRNPRRTDTERLRLAQDHADLLGTHSLQVVAAEIEGYGTFYRIRTDIIRDRREANALCERLMARDQECLPLKVAP